MEEFCGGMVDGGISRLSLRVKYVSEIKGLCTIVCSCVTDDVRLVVTIV